MAFAPLFSKRVWQHVQILVVGAILTPRKRTVTAVLRVMGLSEEKHFQNYHRVLSRAVWSSRAASQVLLKQLVAAFAPTGVLVMGLDDTIERRKGKQIKAKGIYREERAFQSRALCESQWLTLVELNAVGRNPLGATCMGIALLDCAGTI